MSRASSSVHGRREGEGGEYKGSGSETASGGIYGGDEMDMG